jgi:hypothetical protein
LSALHGPAEKRRKLDKKARKGYLVGYLNDGQGYRVYVYESAENERETIEQPHVAGENMRKLKNRHAVKLADFYGYPMMYIAEKLPVDFNETMRSEKRELWKKAMHDQMKLHNENKTWTLVEKLKNQKILSNRF